MERKRTTPHDHEIKIQINKLTLLQGRGLNTYRENNSVDIAILKVNACLVKLRHIIGSFVLGGGRNREGSFCRFIPGRRNEIADLDLGGL